MPIAKKVLSRSSGNWILCGWFECERPGVELHKSIFHEHARDIPCNDPRAQHINFVFCSERHKMLYVHSHISMGNLPPGFAKVL